MNIYRSFMTGVGYILYLFRLKSEGYKEKQVFFENAAI